MRSVTSNSRKSDLLFWRITTKQQVKISLTSLQLSSLSCSIILSRAGLLSLKTLPYLASWRKSLAMIRQKLMKSSWEWTNFISWLTLSTLFPKRERLTKEKRLDHKANKRKEEMLMLTKQSLSQSNNFRKWPFSSTPEIELTPYSLDRYKIKRWV